MWFTAVRARKSVVILSEPQASRRICAPRYAVRIIAPAAQVTFQIIILPRSFDFAAYSGFV